MILFLILLAVVVVVVLSIVDDDKNSGLPKPKEIGVISNEEGRNQ